SPLPQPPLVPYTTLFRSALWLRQVSQILGEVMLLRAATGENDDQRDGNQEQVSHSEKMRVNAEITKPLTRGRLRALNMRFAWGRSEEHTSELQSPDHLVC